MIKAIIISFIIVMFSVALASAYASNFDEINKEQAMEKAFDDMGDYYRVCRDTGHDTSAQFNDKVYCKSEVDGVIMLYPIIVVESVA